MPPPDEPNGSTSNGDEAPRDDGRASRGSAGAPANELLQQLEDRLGAPVVVYWSPNAALDGRAVLALGRVLAQVGKQERLSFVVCSPGGDADDAHRMLSVLREYAERLDIFVPTYAASAATMLCLGADEIHMGPLSELSPIDPQVPVDARLLLPTPFEAVPQVDVNRSWSYVPAGVIRDFLEFAGVVTSGARESTVDPDRLEHLLKPLNPWIIGWYERATKAARNYARQALLDYLLPADDGVASASPDQPARAARAEQIVAHLTEHGSHNASIGRTEARSAGIPVTDIPPDIQELLDELATHYDDAFEQQQLSWVVETTVAFQASAATRRVPCPGCAVRVEMDDDYRFCPECGTALQRRCSGCNAVSRAGWSFCGYCGQALMQTV